MGHVWLIPDLLPKVSVGVTECDTKTPPVIIVQMLSTVLNIIIFEDCRNQWSMSRPLLGLILLNEKVNVTRARTRIISETAARACSNHTYVCVSCSILPT